jgi:phi13 family phage major tail protein
MTNNYKSLIGVDNLYYALVTQDDSSGYVAGTPKYLAPLANIAIKPKASMKTQYFDNIPMDSLFAEGESEGDIEIQGLPLDVKAELLGKTYDAVNGRLYDDGGTPPYVALGFRSQKSDGTFKYYWYLKGQFSPPDDEAATKKAEPDPKSAKMKLTALYTTYLFNVDGVNSRSVKKTEGDTALTAFSATGWFSSVQVPAPGAKPALTCTASPVDGATGVAVGVAPTLTFSNQLVTGTYGVLLTKNDGAIVTATISINAALKVITITPGSNLSASTKYLITVAGVKDIYGQTFANTVYDFTTA